MAYAQQTWSDNNASYPLSAARMTYIEAGIGTAQDTADAASGPVAANGMGVVVHVADATVARPTAFAQIIWIGSVDPNNRVNGDIWMDTSG